MNQTINNPIFIIFYLHINNIQVNFKKITLFRHHFFHHHLYHLLYHSILHLKTIFNVNANKIFVFNYRKLTNVLIYQRKLFKYF